MQEEWREIQGYPNYLVSSLGRVKSLNYNRTGQEQILKPGIRRGYLTVALPTQDGWKNKTVHRLVAAAFLDPDDTKPHVDHINRNKTDNRLENLRWVTESFNSRNQAPRQTNSGEHHICLINGSYKVAYFLFYKHYSKTFKTLEEAVAWRDARLAEREQID